MCIRDRYSTNQGCMHTIIWFCLNCNWDVYKRQFQKEVQYLGHLVSAAGVSMVPNLSLIHIYGNLIAAYRTTNNILNILRTHEPTALEKKTGIYKLMCDDCDAFYVGQTGHGFLKRFVEHRPPTSYRALENMKSSFAKHLVDENTDILILRLTYSCLLYTSFQFCIYFFLFKNVNKRHCFGLKKY